jgi:hypothetical protein
MDDVIPSLLQETFDLLHYAAAAKARRSILDQPLPFFETVSEDCRRERITKFIDGTGSDAAAHTVCAVCAGSFFRSDMDDVPLSKLQEYDSLSPSKLHSSHILTDGMLLHRNPSSFFTDSAALVRVSVCKSCLSSLRQHKTPALSLANGMWIGDVPLVLRVLTLPERVLVARFFPAAYIVKLYPKKKGARFWPSSGLHSGVRGNVSTYCLNTNDIVEMTDTQVMPPSCDILAATIGVTFVGPHNLPQKTMPGFLRVNRRQVHNALLWLKNNNPIYSNVVISVIKARDPGKDLPYQSIDMCTL